MLSDTNSIALALKMLSSMYSTLYSYCLVWYNTGYAWRIMLVMLVSMVKDTINSLKKIYLYRLVILLRALLLCCLYVLSALYSDVPVESNVFEVYLHGVFHM